MNIGDLRVEPVFDGVMLADATAAFKGTTDAQWAPHRQIPVMVLEPVSESPPAG